MCNGTNANNVFIGAGAVEAETFDDGLPSAPQLRAMMINDSSFNITVSDTNFAVPGRNYSGVGTSQSNNTVIATATGATGQYIIIGGGYEAIFYAQRIRNNHPAAVINIVYEGSDLTDDPNIQDVNYWTLAVNNPHFFYRNAIHYLHGDGTGNHGSFSTPIGLLGNSISAYSDEMGPYLTPQSPPNQIKLIQAYTEISPATATEARIIASLAAIFNISTTRSFHPNTPSVLNRHFEFITQESSGDVSRNLGLDVLNTLKNDDNVFFYGEAQDYNFTRLSNGTNGANSTYQLSFKSDGRKRITLTGRVLFKTDPATALRIAGEGGYNRITSAQFPAQYRALVPVNINLNNIAILFTLPDRRASSNKPKWLMFIYTTTQDLQTDTFANSTTGQTILVIEGVDILNKRTMTYDDGANELLLQYNSNRQERESRDAFHEIVSKVYTAVTTQAAPNILPMTSACNPEGTLCKGLTQIENQVPFILHALMLVDSCSQLYPSPYYAPASR